MSTENDELDLKILELLQCPHCGGSGEESRWDECWRCSGIGLNTNTKTGEFLRTVASRIADREIQQHFRNEHQN